MFDEEFIRRSLEEMIDIVEFSSGRRVEPNFEVLMPWDLFNYLDLLNDQFEDGIYGNVDVGEYSVIEGLVFAGKDTQIKPFSYVRGPVILGNGSVIGCEIKNSVILRGSKSSHRSSYVGDSIIGRNCNVGAGSQFANLRFDKKNIGVRDENGEVYDSKRRKLGAIIEDECNFGVNCKVMPGSYFVKGSNLG